jgi:hypothetical protein
MFVVCRASFIGISAHYTNLMFGDNFSTLMGLVWTSAWFRNHLPRLLRLTSLFYFAVGGSAVLSNYFWSAIALGPMQGNFLTINIIMTAVAVIPTLILAFLVYRWRKESEGSAAGSVLGGEYTKLATNEFDEELETEMDQM